MEIGYFFWSSCGRRSLFALDCSYDEVMWCVWSSFPSDIGIIDGYTSVCKVINISNIVFINDFILTFEVDFAISLVGCINSKVECSKEQSINSFGVCVRL